MLFSAHRMKLCYVQLRVEAVVLAYYRRFVQQKEGLEPLTAKCREIFAERGAVLCEQNCAAAWLAAPVMLRVLLAFPCTVVSSAFRLRIQKEYKLTPLLIAAG
ncbi:MAG: hypothetical protein D3910_04335 [Candidatus Electrothrix sp. ATG2]|nr:hypothetical protein [Candidatus Electrothrix sp. ATG2]